MDTQLLSEARWIGGALVVIAMALTFLALVSVFILAAVARVIAMQPKISFGDQAKRLLDRDETTKLIELCEARLTEFPSDAEAWWYLGQAAYRRLQLKRALDAVGKVKALRPDWPWTEQFEKVIEEQLSQQRPEPALHLAPLPPIILNVKSANPFGIKNPPPRSSPDPQHPSAPAS